MFYHNQSETSEFTTPLAIPWISSLWSIHGTSKKNEYPCGFVFGYFSMLSKVSTLLSAFKPSSSIQYYQSSFLLVHHCTRVQNVLVLQVFGSKANKQWEVNVWHRTWFVFLRNGQPGQKHCFYPHDLEPLHPYQPRSYSATEWGDLQR